MVKVLTPDVGLAAETPGVIELDELDTGFAGFAGLVDVVVGVGVGVVEVGVAEVLDSEATFAGVDDCAAVGESLHVTLTVNWESHWA